MEIKKYRFELGIDRLEGLSTSPLIINLGKIILPKNTKFQSLNEFWKTHDHARIFEDEHAWRDHCDIWQLL